MVLRFIDICAGIGGFRLGLNKLGWECVYTCEIDPTCHSTYIANFGGTIQSEDVFKLDAQMLPTYDVLCAGFPCQPFSIAGKRKGLSDSRGIVLLKILELVSETKPEIVLLENVPNLLSHDSQNTYKVLQQRLVSCGYQVERALLDSAYFGVPQSRKRLYIVGTLGERKNKFQFTQRRTQKMAFRKFIVPGDHSIPISDRWQFYIDLYTGRKRLSEAPFTVPKTRTQLERINAGTDLNDCIFQLRSSGIRACSIDAPLPTFAVSHSGGGAMIPVYSKERRHLGVAEIKRLMGFPDSFVFPVARTHAIKQLSNAVCPPVITSIGRDINAYLEVTQPTENPYFNDVPAATDVSQLGLF